MIAPVPIWLGYPSAPIERVERTAALSRLLASSAGRLAQRGLRSARPACDSYTFCGR